MKGYTHEIITLWYRPPEILMGKREYGSEVDIWSIGCIIAELINLHPLFVGKDEESQINDIFSNIGLPSVEEWPDIEQLPDWDKITLDLQGEPPGLRALLPTLDWEGITLMKGLLACNPKNRITLRSALESQWFDSIRDEIDEY